MYLYSQRDSVTVGGDQHGPLTLGSSFISLQLPEINTDDCICSSCGYMAPEHVIRTEDRMTPNKRKLRSQEVSICQVIVQRKHSNWDKTLCLMLNVFPAIIITLNSHRLGILFYFVLFLWFL